MSYEHGRLSRSLTSSFSDQWSKIWGAPDTMRFLRAATIPRAWSKLNAVLAAVLTVAVAMACCTNPGPGRPPHVLLVTVDTLRADHCSVYGYGRRTSPTLERLARTGVLFETAYAPMATTAPSHATMLSLIHI